MNKQIEALAKQTGYIWHASGDPQIYEFTPEKLEKFARLIAEHCAQLCGSQADKKNIRSAFDIPVGSDVKYPGPEAHNSVVSQYTREYNIPKA
jgi:hypothetical protein